MHLTRLELDNFRNYAQLALDLTPGIALFQGANAAGKTSLLEAVFYLATAKSPHAGADRELIRWGASSEPIPFARVQAHIVKRNDTHTQLEIVLAQTVETTPHEERGTVNGRIGKRIKVNGVPKRAMDLLGELIAVLFLPKDLDLVFGAPSDRRRYLDITLSQIDPRYGRALLKYNQVLEQRNSLLREFRERAYNAHELAIWDHQLVEAGAYVIARRTETIERYNGLIAQVHPRLTNEREALCLVYQPSVTSDALTQEDPVSLATLTRQFAHQIERLRPRELGAGTTLVGPHRDDVHFFIEPTPKTNAPPMDANLYASRGQGRTIALSLKLAEVALMRAETGEDPVLLLDDVMSELDAPRRAALARTLLDARQAIVTTTDLADFPAEFLESARIGQVHHGAIEEI